jgi:hypothetical protein
LLPGEALGVQEVVSEPAIADNSFFIEEAYNQEPGVIQHITSLAAAGAGRRDLYFSFTQEWPFRSQRHQLSYTLPVTRLDGRSAGLGDVLLNYRLQLGAGTSRWAFAPRLSLVLPTGSVRRGLGDGSIGLQANLPLSFELTRQIVTHWNAGATILPRAQGTLVGGRRPRHTLTHFAVGGSVIALTHLPVQVMFESVLHSQSEIAGGGAIRRTTEWIASPGIRAAVSLGSLQVVPGVALPFVRSGGSTEHGAFLYLSLEHPFRTTVPTSPSSTD